MDLPDEPNAGAGAPNALPEGNSGAGAGVDEKIEPVKGAGAGSCPKRPRVGAIDVK